MQSVTVYSEKGVPFPENAKGRSEWLRHKQQCCKDGKLVGKLKQ